MRITFIIPHADMTGGVKVVAIYAQLLEDRGHEVMIVSTPKPPLTLTQKIKLFLKNISWPVRELSHLDRISVAHKVLDRYRSVTNKDVPDADAVIATWWETAEWVNALSAEKGKKFYFIQGYDVELGPHLPINRVKASYFLPLHKITISQWLVNIMKNEYGVNNISLVPNSVDPIFFNGPERSKQSMPTVGFVYSTTSLKGCDIIIEALNKARVKVPQLRILSFGACLPVDYLPLPVKVEFHYRPSQEKIREIYSSCDYWLFGSRAEGFGLPLLEAMACRTPVIATPAGAAPELICQGGGILLEDWEVITFSQTVLKALDFSDGKWLEMSREARAIASCSTWEETALLFEKALLAV